MLVSTHNHNLAEHFSKSEQFLYLLTTITGEYVYVNPLFQQTFGFDNQHSNIENLLHTDDISRYKQVLEECHINKEVPIQIELNMQVQGGSWRIIKWEFSFSKDNTEKENFIQAIGIITKMASANVNEFAKRVGIIPERYKAYEQSPEGIWRFDLKIPIQQSATPDELINHCRKHGFLAECNDNMARMYGYEKAEELVGVRMEDLMDFKDESRINNLRKFISNGLRSTLVETKEFDRYGNTRYFLNNMDGTIEKGMLVRIWGTQQDITEQRLAEDKIKHLAMLTANVSDIVISQDKDFIIVSWNKAAEETYGYSAKETIGRRVHDILHFEFQDISRAQFFEQLERKGTWQGEAYVTNRHGKPITVLVTVTKMVNDAGETTGYVSISKDITEKRKADAQLQKSELFYRNLIADSLDGILLTDEKGSISFASASVTQILGFKTEEVMDRNVFEYVHPDDKLKAQKAFENELKMQPEEPFINIRLRNKINEWKWCIVRGPNMFHNPYVGKMVVYYHDDTLRKNAEVQLKNQATILENVSDLIMTTDFDLNILSWNKVAEKVVGCTAAEAIGEYLGDVVRPDFGSISPRKVIADLEKKGIWQGELSFINKQGVRKVILHTASYLVNESGERISIISTGKDITEKKEAEELFRENELFYRNLFLNSLDGVLVTNSEGLITFASPSVTTIFGYETEFIVGESTFDFVHPDDRELAITAFQAELEALPFNQTISVRLKDAREQWIWCNVRGHNLMDNPYIKGIVVYLYDDTLRKQTEEALKKEESRFRQQAVILKNVSDAIVTTDLDRIVTSWNKVAENLTGIEEKEALGKELKDILTINYSPFTGQQMLETVFNYGIWRGEISYTGVNGDTNYLLHTVSLMHDEEGNKIGILGVGKDITQRKKAEARLQESEHFYRNMIYHSLDGIVMTDATGQITYSGPSAIKISGYKTEELLGHSLYEFVHPDDIQKAVEAFMLEFKNQSVLNYLLLRLKHATRGWVWCTVRGHNLLDNPAFKSFVIYFTDDTERKKIEDKLRDSEQRFRNLIYNLKQGVLLQDEQSRMLLCNNAALEMLGLTEEQLLGSSSFDPRWNVIHEDGTNFPSETHPVPVVIQTRKPVRDVVMGVYRPVTNDRVWLLVNADPVIDPEGNFLHVICSFTDITEQKRLAQELTSQEIQKQKQITQATIDGQEKERLEIGKELHDNISQHLTTTRLYLEVIKEKADGDIKDMLVRSHKNLVSIINEIRQLSQSLVPPSLGDIGLIESIQELAGSLKNAHTIPIDFYYRHFDETQLPENLKLMLFRVIQEQVNNIIRHANAHTIKIRLQSDAEYLTLIIADDGVGFDINNYKKGLGFKNIANRVSLFNGKVEKETAPGEGCILTVRVPVPGIELKEN
jgi:PAS domain S-box-containing protein